MYVNFNSESHPSSIKNAMQFIFEMINSENLQQAKLLVHLNALKRRFILTKQDDPIKLYHAFLQYVVLLICEQTTIRPQKNLDLVQMAFSVVSSVGSKNIFLLDDEQAPAEAITWYRDRDSKLNLLQEIEKLSYNNPHLLALLQLLFSLAENAVDKSTPNSEAKDLIRILCLTEFKAKILTEFTEYLKPLWRSKEAPLSSSLASQLQSFAALTLRFRQGRIILGEEYTFEASELENLNDWFNVLRNLLQDVAGKVIDPVTQTSFWEVVSEKLRGIAPDNSNVLKQRVFASWGNDPIAYFSDQNCYFKSTYENLLQSARAQPNFTRGHFISPTNRQQIRASFKTAEALLHLIIFSISIPALQAKLRADKELSIKQIIDLGFSCSCSRESSPIHEQDPIDASSSHAEARIIQPAARNIPLVEVPRTSELRDSRVPIDRSLRGEHPNTFLSSFPLRMSLPTIPITSQTSIRQFTETVTTTTTTTIRYSFYRRISRPDDTSTFSGNIARSSEPST